MDKLSRMVEDPTSNVSQDTGKTPTSPPLPNKKSDRDLGRFIPALVTTFGAVLVNIAYEKWASGVPDWLFILLCLIPLSLWFYWVWTHEKIKKYRHLIYTYPIVSLVIMIVIGACIGGSIGTLLWWTVYKQPPPSTPTQTQMEQAVDAVDKPSTKAAPTPTPQPTAALQSNSTPARPNSQRRRATPNDTENILLGRKKRSTTNK